MKAGHELMTVVVVARDAEATIERCMRSILEGCECPILLVDDYSIDQTSRIAKQLGGTRLKVTIPEEKMGLGNARQAALEVVATPYLMWLDADDAILSNRVDAMLGALKTGFDAVWDSAELYDGATETKIRDMKVPGFLLKEGALVRNFERNYLPGTAWPAVHTTFARRVGYDVGLVSGEDIDFLLRAVCEGGRIGAIPDIGYRQYADATITSRNREQQRDCVRTVLWKHSYSAIRGLYQEAGYSARLARLACVYVATFRGENEVAESEINDLAAELEGQSVIEWEVEPEGAFPNSWNWYLCFLRGTLAAKRGDLDVAWDAFGELSNPFDETAEVLNNSGVVAREMGREDQAVQFFERAIALFPEYRDANQNFASPDSKQLTLLPLGHLPNRQEYESS